MSETQMIQHHTKYLEIHGRDEIVWMEKEEHERLHRTLRKTGKCNIPIEELYIIATRAHQRTEKYRRAQKKYHKQHTHCIWFTATLQQNVQLFELIVYNSVTGNVYVSSEFHGNNGNRLLYIDIEI